MTRLTLCLIARDEEAMLPDCLASVRGCVDAMVVVDTGSRDASVEIARRAGAEVVHHDWHDDFAAARNAALDRVEDGFLLVLDADERLAPGAGEVLRAEIARDRIDWALLPLYNATSLDAQPADVLSGRACQSAPALLARLLRRTPDLRWESIVHEHVTRWALANPRSTRLEAPILHYGDVASVRAAKRKDGRNLRLLERRCQQEPDDPFPASYLCQELIKAGEKQRAFEVAERAWRGIRRGRRNRGAAPDAVLAATLLAQLCLERGDTQRACDVLSRALRWSGEHPNLRYLLGCTAEEALLANTARDATGTPRGWPTGDDSQLAAAVEQFERAIAFGDRAFAEPTLPGFSSFAAWTRIGTLELQRGRADDALRAFDHALAVRPDHGEARLGRVEALLAAGDAAHALHELEPLLAEDTADAWILAASAAWRAGGQQAALSKLPRAMQSAREGRIVARHRLGLLKEVVSQARSPGATA